MNFIDKNRLAILFSVLGVVLLAGIGYNLSRSGVKTTIPTSMRTMVATETAKVSTISVTNSGTTAAQTVKCRAVLSNKNDVESVLPDPLCTPGATNPAVTQDTIRTTICTVGYTTMIRPPESYTEPLKIQSIKDYGYTDTNPAHYSYDHLIPLEAGGNPTDSKNIWAQPLTSSKEKDRYEAYIHKQICLGELSLLEAQRRVSTNWYQYYIEAGLNK